MHIDQLSTAELQSQLATLEQQYDKLKGLGLALDLTRGKPCTEQVALADGLDGILQGNYRAQDGTDTRNYGGLDGLPEARALFGELLGLPAGEIMVGGNSSLTLMYQVVEFALSEGLQGPESAWGNNDTVKFICPVPGYDRHFSVCEHLGIEMVTVPMLDTGPDMDAVEALVKRDESIKGMWCVPRFSNPTGCVYSDDTVARIAALPGLAGANFLVMWDNAYAVHTLYDDAPALASIADHCRARGTLDQVFQFGSTSKITFASAGVAFLASSPGNLAALSKHLSYQTIGPDKVNQLRHVRFLRDMDKLSAHMAKHAALIRPRFESVLDTLESELAGTGMGSWTRPRGGYFISFDTLPGLGREVVRLAGAIGVKLTPAGATFPYGLDPLDSNIRLSPTFATEQAVKDTVAAFVVCVRLATVRQKLQQQSG
ncbi:MAG: aminotransferase class I/II-fold pyridoxal phosphate-dependent enzyme [Pseudomonadales bacterium]|nr:aminotransferase class I/II-fold pyridoxal phosphate-dependent enzyme [Halioglobus sp.]MCP5123541.1 aminotransferase class I/II-fold pyridoxal phosphate-dependent enzyme [Pseudomonadales bacterium]MCP5193621.1 aminotransferase class I/II-fold pyridoxal phosphate-dependent enzyme [Pseudomonadales bacterium]